MADARINIDCKSNAASYLIACGATNGAAGVRRGVNEPCACARCERRSARSVYSSAIELPKSGSDTPPSAGLVPGAGQRPSPLSPSLRDVDRLA